MPRTRRKKGAAGSDSSAAAGSDSRAEMPRKKGAAGSDSSGAAGSDSRAEMPRKKAVEASSRGAPTVHPGGEMAGAPIQAVSMVHPKETVASASHAALIRGVSVAPTVHPGGEMAAAPVQAVSMVHPEETVASASRAALIRGVSVVHPGEMAASASPSQRVSMVHPEETVASASRAALIREVSVVHPGEMAASVSPSQRVPMVQAAARAAPSGGGVHMVHTAEAAACSSAEMPYKKADLSSSGGVPTVHTGEGAMVYPGEWVEVMALRGGSEALVDLCCNTAAQDCEESGAKHHTKKARIVSSRMMPQEHCTEDKADTGLSGGVLQKRTSKVEADTSLSGVMLHEHPAKEADTSLSGELLHEHPAKEADTSLSGELLDQQEHPAKEADTSLSGELLDQQEHPAMEADTSLSGELLDQQEHPAEEADAAKDIHEYDPDECVVDVKTAEWHIQDRHEAKLLIEQLNQSGLGEDISDQEFLAYFNKLACRPPWFNLKAELEDEDLDQQLIDHALCRFRYYKYKLTQPKEELHADNLLEEGEDDKEEREYLAMLKEKQLLYREEGDTTSEEDETEADNLMDKNEADFNLEFLEENRFFISFEKDGTLDWFFHPAYCECASLSDYQRLVLQNYGGTEYTRWSYYHSYLHSYDVEQEYVKYCEELSKQLKWMEDYIDIDPSSIKWDYVSSRGAYQAIKIAATSFPKITPTLAYNGYDECKESMGYHHIYLKEYDGLYFEIWQRVKKGMSFRAALEDLCVLNRFPLRQSLMQIALGNEFTMTSLEKDFRTCTAAIRPGVEEDEAKELIADAVKKRVDKPKFYDDYIRKKIKIAHIVGILPSEKTETDATV